VVQIPEYFDDLEGDWEYRKSLRFNAKWCIRKFLELHLRMLIHLI